MPTYKQLRLIKQFIPADIWNKLYIPDNGNDDDIISIEEYIGKHLEEITMDDIGKIIQTACFVYACENTDKGEINEQNNQ